MLHEHGEEALTLKEAAERLGVKPQRISQMLADGELDGPAVTTGARAPKNIGRVWLSSLTTELERRGSRTNTGSGAARRIRSLELRVATLEAEGQRSRPQIGSPDEAARAAERAARAAAQRMKVTLEVATESLQQEQEVVATLRRENADLRERLAAAERRVQTLDAMSQAFSDSLSQLLGPDNPTDE